VSAAVNRPVWYSAATISRLKAMHAMDDGTTKKHDAPEADGDARSQLLVGRGPSSG